MWQAAAAWGGGYPGTGLAWQGCPNLGGAQQGDCGEPHLPPSDACHPRCRVLCLRSRESPPGGTEVVPKQGGVALPEGPLEHPIPKGEMVSVPGRGLARPPAALLAGHGWAGWVPGAVGGCWGGWQWSPPPPHIWCCPSPH